MKTVNFIVRGIFLCAFCGLLLHATNAFAAEVPINKENFPGKFFREYVLDKIDKDKDKVLSESELRNTKRISTELKASDWGMVAADYKGIEFFTELEELEIAGYLPENEDECGWEADVSLDLSNNKKLKRLSCESAELKQLDLSGLTQLEKVDLRTSKCPNQDLSKLNQLRYLRIYQYSSLPGDEEKRIVLDDAPFLELLQLRGFEKAEIDFQKMPALQDVYLSGMILSQMDLSGNENLQRVDCYDVQGMSFMRLQNCPKLKYITLQAMNVESIYVPNCPLLENFSATGIHLTTLDLTDCPKLERIFLYLKDEVNPLHLIGGSSIKWLRISGGTITELDMRDLVHVKDLHLGADVKKLLLCDSQVIRSLTLKSGVKEFDFTPFTQMEQLQIEYADVKQLDLRKNHKLKSINCLWAQKLGKIRFSTKAKYKRVMIERANIKKLDVRKVQIKELFCRNSKLKNLYVKGNKTIKKLDCQNNQLKKLDLRGCKKLKVLLRKGNKNLKKSKIKR